MSYLLRPGYGIVHRCVMEYKGLSIPAKALYSLLQSYTGSAEGCFPSQQKLAEDLGCTERAIQKWAAELESKKLLKIKRTGRSNFYTPLVPKGEPEVGSDTNPGSGLIRTPVRTKINKKINSEEASVAGGLVPSQNTAPGQARKANNHGDPKPLITFDWSTGEFENLGDAEVARWKETFPAVDVDCEIAKAAAWLTADRRRAKSQYRRFLVGWLTRSQDKGGSRPWAASRR